MDGVKKLTDKPVRFVIDTEVHNDHTFGHWVFSPPGVVINAEGAGAAMKKQFDPKRVEALAAESPEMAEAAKGYKMIVPQIEYRNHMTINLGERTFEAYLFEKRSQRGGYGSLAAQRTRALRGVSGERAQYHQPPAVRAHPRCVGELQADEVPQPGDRGAGARCREHDKNF